MRFVHSRLAAGLAALFVAPRAPATVAVTAQEWRNTSDAPIAQAVQAATPDEDQGLTGEWRAIAGSPCGNRVALDPAKALGPLAFVRCESSEDGCTALAPRQRIELRAGAEVVRLVRGTPMMAYARVLTVSDAPTPMAVNVVEPLGDAPVFAVATPLGRAACTFSSHVGTWGFALSTMPYAGQRGPMVLAWAPFDHPSNLTTAQVLLATWPGAPVWADAADVPTVAVANRVLFVQTWLGINGPLRGHEWGSTVRLFDPLAGKLAVPSSITARSPIALGSGAVALVKREERAVLGYIGPGGAVTVLRLPPARFEVSNLAVDRSGERDVLVWTERAAQSAWLYSASFVTPAAALRATKIAVVTDPHAPLVANGGEVLTLDPDGRARILRLSTGRSSWLSAPPTERFRRPLWIDEHEVWLQTDRGIVRLAR